MMTAERPFVPFSGWLVFPLLLLAGGLSVWSMVEGGQRLDVHVPGGGWFLGGGLFALAVVVVLLRGLFIVNPNDTKVLVLFGVYKGTVSTNGFFWANPFMIRARITLRARNFEGDKLKVNDQNGNPIEISAVVVWRIRNTAQALFDVDDYMHYVATQSEAAVRALAGTYPYDSHLDDENHSEISLREDRDQVNKVLEEALTERLSRAGIEVMEARLTHLAYAPEIAGAMLQRQQAAAVVAARRLIVDGAVGMVQMALKQLEQNAIVELDDERRAAMVSNLLVVLCGDRNVQPVINTGTLYG
jgi:hypothetical protein